MMDELWPSLEWRVLHQGVNTFLLVRVFCRRAQRWHASLEEEPGPCLQGCTTVSWLLSYLHIPSLPWLATLWTCLLELREVCGSWMKAISCNQERFLCPGAPQGPTQICLCSLPRREAADVVACLLTGCLPLAPHGWSPSWQNLLFLWPDLCSKHRAHLSLVITEQVGIEFQGYDIFHSTSCLFPGQNWRNVSATFLSKFLSLILSHIFFY